MAIFDDFFSSSKGPGVIGTLLAVFVLASFTGLGFLVFDGRFNGDQATKLNQTVDSQGSRIAALKAMSEEYENGIVTAKEHGKLQDELNRLQRMISDKKKILADAEASVAQARSSLADTRQKWEDYKNDYRSKERAKMIGKQIEEIVTIEGEVFKNVTVREINNLSMRILHDSGPKSIKWNQLPLEMQDRFQFDEKQAAEAQAVVDKSADDWNKGVQRGNSAAKVAKLKNHILLKQHELDKRERGIRSNKGQIASNIQSIANSRRLAAEARSKHSIAVAAGRRSSHLATATRWEGAATAKERNNNQLAENSRTLQSEISKIQQEIGEVEQQIKDVIAAANKK